jgi:hypothetical protein
MTFNRSIERLCKKKIIQSINTNQSLRKKKNPFSRDSTLIQSIELILE